MKGLPKWKKWGIMDNKHNCDYLIKEGNTNNEKK